MKKPWSSFCLLCIATSVTMPTVWAQTQRNWTGGNGTGFNWNDSANWQNSNVPISPTYWANFQSGTTATINVAVGTTTYRMSVEAGADIELVLASDTEAPETAAMTFDALFRIGQTTNGTGASFTLSGDGVLRGSSFQVGSTTNSSGNIFTVGGNARIDFTTLDSNSTVGRFGINNTLLINNGQAHTVAALHLGSADGIQGNRVQISGAGTKLTVNSGSASRGLRVGNGSGTNYATGVFNNYVHISDGGTLVMTTESGSATRSNELIVGGLAYAHENYILVEGTGSKLELGRGTATSAGTTVNIGNSGKTNVGGNYIAVRDGGSIVSETGHAGNIYIHGHNSDGTHHGANYFLVGDDGTVDVGSDFLVSGGSLKLSSTGVLSAANVVVSEGGRFEAAGAGFFTTGETNVDDGILEVGFAEDTAASILSLASIVRLNSADAGLVMSIYNASSVDQIHFETDGELFVTDAKLNLTLNGYNPLLGDSWVLFTGETGNITGLFDLVLPTLNGGLEWDVSAFNETGEWTLNVIPEPSSGILLLLGSLLAVRRRERMVD